MVTFIWTSEALVLVGRDENGKAEGGKQELAGDHGVSARHSWSVPGEVVGCDRCRETRTWSRCGDVVGARQKGEDRAVHPRASLMDIC